MRAHDFRVFLDLEHREFVKGQLVNFRDGSTGL